MGAARDGEDGLYVRCWGGGGGQGFIKGSSEGGHLCLPLRRSRRRT